MKESNVAPALFRVASGLAQITVLRKSTCMKFTDKGKLLYATTRTVETGATSQTSEHLKDTGRHTTTRTSVVRTLHLFEQMY